MKFIEERRYLLQEFLINVTKHNYLWQSDEFTAWVRTTPQFDLITDLKQKTRKEVRSTAKPNFDHEIADRIERYSRIFDKLQVNHSVKDRDTVEMSNLVDQTHLFANVNVQWLKNMTNVFKDLSDKNDYYLNSQRGL